MAAVNGKAWSADSYDTVDAALGEDLDPMPNTFGSAAMKLHHQRVLTRRALDAAVAAGEGVMSLEETASIELTVNGEHVSATVAVRQHLVDFLRIELGLTGSHIGCEHGICGACSVRVDGAVVRGCLMLAVQADGAEVETVEGVTDTGEIADLQEMFVTRNALQCGYCTPGMLMTAAELLKDGRTGDARGHPRIPLRQLLPLHRLPRHRRCGGSHAETAAR